MRIPIALQGILRDRDFVLVEGDRGVDIGQFVCPDTKRDESIVSSGGSVLRLASPDEITTMHKIREREEPAVLSALRSIADDVRFEGSVEDVEYQWDMKKLTVVVKRPTNRRFVDFKKFQRSAFTQFRCRIWVVYTDEIAMRDWPVQVCELDKGKK
jgi:cell fate regulator YaaT (PSP1 superfamily)